MQISVNNLNIKVLGDVHLGRNFRTGVPLHRVGDRERWQMETFKKSILEGSECIHVCMGDLFDRFVVSTNVLIDTYQAYAEAAEKRRERTFYIIQGNHDISRDVDKASSFNVLQLLLEKFPNIVFVTKPTIAEWMVGLTNSEYLLLMPYDAFKTGKELLDEVVQPAKRFAAVFGHYDITHIGDQEPHNLAPLEDLSKITSMLVTGHEHNPKTFFHGTMQVVVTGSMQPYSFAEDAGGSIYKTLTLKEFEDLRSQNYDFAWNCLRILVEDTEQLPNDVNCLQLISKHQNAEEEQSIEVELIDFDMNKMFAEAMGEAGVTDPEVQVEVLGIYNLMKEESTNA